LEEERKISKEEGTLKAVEKNNCLYHETSALTGEGVDELFEKVTEEYLKRKKV
jgi:GTPase SAR1 family protein